jgi:hypothetical protein
VARATAWLQAFLADGPRPRPSTEIAERGAALGFMKAVLRHAKVRTGAQAVKRMADRSVKRGTCIDRWWEWKLPHTPVSVPSTKVCTRCKQAKALAAFRRTARGGRRRWCIACYARSASAIPLTAWLPSDLLARVAPAPASSSAAPGTACGAPASIPDPAARCVPTSAPSANASEMLDSAASASEMLDSAVSANASEMLDNMLTVPRKQDGTWRVLVGPDPGAALDGRMLVGPPDVGAAFDHDERAQAVQSLLARNPDLSRQEQEIVRMLAVPDRKRGQIARLLGKSSNAIRQAKFRLVNKLRR